MHCRACGYASMLTVAKCVAICHRSQANGGQLAGTLAALDVVEKRLRRSDRQHAHFQARSLGLSEFAAKFIQARAHAREVVGAHGRPFAQASTTRSQVATSNHPMWHSRILMPSCLASHA